MVINDFDIVDSKDGFSCGRGSRGVHGRVHFQYGQSEGRRVVQVTVTPTQAGATVTLAGLLQTARCNAFFFRIRGRGFFSELADQGLIA